MADKTTNWVKLRAFSGPVFAEMAKAALDEAAIPCILRKDFLTSAYGVGATTNAGFQTILLVPDGCLDVARETLAGMIDDDEQCS